MNLIKKHNQKTIKKLVKNIDGAKEIALRSEFEMSNYKDYDKDYEKEKNSLLFGSNVEIIQNTVEKSYLPVIAKKYSPIKFEIKDFSYSSRVRIVQITKWVTDNEEDSLDKLSNVYSALSGVECSVSLVYRRTKSGTKIYFIITNQTDMIDPAIVDSYYNTFVSALKGNFPGVEIKEVENIGSYNNTPKDSLIGEWFAENNSNAVAMITNIASESSEKFVSQGIEKLLDGVVPTDDDTEYTLVLLAEPVSKAELTEQKILYEEMYTQLSPYETAQISMNISEAVNTTKNLSNSISVSKTKGHSILIWNRSKTSNVSSTYGFSESKNNTKGESISSNRINYRVRETLQTIESHIKRLQLGDALGMWKFASYVLADNYSVAQSVSSMYRSLTEGNESYVESAAINLWNDNRRECKESIDTIKSYLKAFIHPRFALLGTEDLMYSEINADVENVVIHNKRNKNFTEDIITLPAVISGYTMVSGNELSMSMNMPNSAVSGLPVIECAKFGRDVISQSFNYGAGQVINIGNIFHMQQEEVNKPVFLDAKCMTEHTFITGSTGAGKSTTIYRILSEASKLKTPDDKDVTFMVIEPAKGEYKSEISRISDKPVFVYGTNPKTAEGELLRINPFAFPIEKIHILEHLDRLIEIFNVCWPMYAAMPAVLKKGIEESYKACGWDLLESENTVSSKLFPTFADVCNHIRTVIDSSDYSAENKGDYKGALVTRLESLTNGINGLIFTADAVSDNQLFENNSIVDLSRVGSTETKALIMGLLVMKLQEYRMSSDDKPNAELKHITVLEEAHNLLKRTSTEQNAEGSNLLGKSVEMLSNSIAEMRTYGEAFIIADQAPGLLDMSVIRNTNTKIIMRLPDYSDRELVGKAANLNDDQIVEIAKLRPGVAAVYYNGWINPVLCKIPKTESVDGFLPANNIHERSKYDKFELKRKIIEILIHRITPENIDDFSSELIKAGYSGEFISKFILFGSEPNNDYKIKMLPSLFYLFFNPSAEIKQVCGLKDSRQLSYKLSESLGFERLGVTGKDAETIILNLLHEQNLRNAGFDEVYARFGEYYSEKFRIGG